MCQKPTFATPRAAYANTSSARPSNASGTVRPSSLQPAAQASLQVFRPSARAQQCRQLDEKHRSLRHLLVCGLHVNLEVKPLAENTRKSNNWWPDMPNEQLGLLDGVIQDRLPRRRSCCARETCSKFVGRPIVSAHNRLIRRAMFDDAAGLQVSAASVRPFLLMSKESIQRHVELSHAAELQTMPSQGQ